MSKTWCVYYVKNGVNGKWMLGVSEEEGWRKKVWGNREYLRNNKHGVVAMQSDWNEVGEENFDTGRLEGGYPTRDDAEARMRETIMNNPLLCYNAAPSAMVVPPSPSPEAQADERRELQRIMGELTEWLWRNRAGAP